MYRVYLLSSICFTYILLIRWSLPPPSVYLASSLRRLPTGGFWFIMYIFYQMIIITGCYTLSRINSRISLFCLFLVITTTNQLLLNECILGQVIIYFGPNVVWVFWNLFFESDFICAIIRCFHPSSLPCEIMYYFMIYPSMPFPIYPLVLMLQTIISNLILLQILLYHLHRRLCFRQICSH